MEECHSGSKRKKRKTRKCLNEIRKKSRMTTTNSTSVTTSVKVGTKINNNMAKVLNCNNNYITSNRLTLAIFPKAVRSETITRPLLAEIRHEPGNINISDIVRSRSSVRPENTHATYEKEEHEHSFNLSKNGTNMFSVEEVSDELVVNDEVDSDICHMKSSSDVGRAAGSSSARSAASPAPPSAGPAARRREHHAYRMYERFIKNIPMFIQTHAPSLLSGDSMKKPRAALHSMYVEGRRRLAAGSPGPPAAARSPSPASPLAPPEPPPQSILHDTPEYTYFPHKLNQ